MNKVVNNATPLLSSISKTLTPENAVIKGSKDAVQAIDTAKLGMSADKHFDKVLKSIYGEEAVQGKYIISDHPSVYARKEKLQAELGLAIKDFESKFGVSLKGARFEQNRDNKRFELDDRVTDPKIREAFENNPLLQDGLYALQTISNSIGAGIAHKQYQKLYEQGQTALADETLDKISDILNNGNFLIYNGDKVEHQGLLKVQAMYPRNDSAVAGYAN